MGRKSFIHMDERYENRFMGHGYLQNGADFNGYDDDMHMGRYYCDASYFDRHGNGSLCSQQTRTKNKQMKNCMPYQTRRMKARVDSLNMCRSMYDYERVENRYGNCTVSGRRHAYACEDTLPDILFTTSNTALQFRILSKLFVSPPPPFFQFSPFILIMAVIYTRRHSCHMKIYHNFVNFFFISCHIATKIWNDRAYETKSWIRTEDKKMMECYFCKGINYNFIVEQSEFKQWMSMLCS